MKKMLFIWLLSGLFISATTAQYDDALPTGYEGDNFSLEGALDLFKNSNTLEQFERRLNTRDNWVNNLDLNFDGRTDYIRVEHRREGDFHAIILQALVGSWEVQDVAVIEIEKVSRRDAILQIIGDEDLYGEEIIVEAFDRNTLVRDRYDYGYNTSYVNVYNWSSVQFIFGRNYVRYVSPFHHNYYPTWWSPWNRCGWDVFRPRVRHYHAYYRPVRIHRVRNVHRFYRPNRSYCNSVLNRTNKVRRKHGKRAINRPRVQRNKVDRNRGLTNKGRNVDRSNIRKRDRGISTSRGSVATRSNNRTSSRPNGGNAKNNRETRGISKYSSSRSTRNDVSTRPSRGTTKTSKRTSSRTTRTVGNSGSKRSKKTSSRTKSYSSKSNNRSSNSKTKSASSSRKMNKQSSSRSNNKRNNKSISKKSSRTSKSSNRSNTKRGSTSKRSTRSGRQ